MKIKGIPITALTTSILGGLFGMSYTRLQQHRADRNENLGQVLDDLAEQTTPNTQAFCAHLGLNNPDCVYSQGAPWQSSSPWLNELMQRAGINTETYAHHLQRAVKPASVQISPLKQCPAEILKLIENDPARTVCVGGWSTALVALKMQQGKGTTSDTPVLWCDTGWKPKHSTAANHIEPQTWVEAPLYLTNYSVLDFLLKETVPRLLSAKPYTDIMNPKSPWKSLNLVAMSKTEFDQFLQASKVVVGYEQNRLSAKYDSKFKHALEAKVTKELEASYRVLQDVDLTLKQIGLVGILSSSVSSLIVCRTPEEYRAFQALQGAKSDLHEITYTEAKRIYGLPEQQEGGYRKYFRKDNDRILSFSGLEQVAQGIKHYGGECKDWRLTHVWADKDKTATSWQIVEFVDVTGKKYYIKADKLFCSLGSVEYEPRQSAMISVTGLSITGFIKTSTLFHPIVCGGTTHVIPMGEAINGYTPVRITCNAAVGPRHRTDNFYSTEDAIRAITSVQAVFGEKSLEVVFISGCDRAVSSANFSEYKMFNPNFIIVQGQGGGGLTQAGALYDCYVQDKAMGSA